MLRRLGPVLSVCVLACDGASVETGDDEAETSGDATSEDDGTDTDTGDDETGDPPLDSDEDGLTDDEEAMLGTDPLDKDSDDDNYWDSWEVIEGTDPLDPASRIYTGYWPYNPDKDALEQGSWATASTEVGAAFPRAELLDHNGDMVDLYDFANFTVNPTNQPAFLLFDVAAQWCGPCHLVGEWISGTDNADTASMQNSYPYVREKVYDLRVWWLTIVTQNSASGPPTLGDAESWAMIHPINVVPVFADEDQQLLEHFGSMQFPHFFLVDSQMRIEYFPPSPTGADPYPALTLINNYL